ncbi:hypothetical protein J1605_016931 [Eschrichtius robustus]|uniref:WW domain-containing protein n=1 Tax=Eschrichtius robustus TaxID=9764 RepID=A0AB34I136_ESCRO|nr:hypothetical protein J1605_016931 [Eschrichtius robustus]
MPAVAMWSWKEDEGPAFLDRYTKPLTFADCISDELPLGWEEAYDPQVGDYFIDHNTKMGLTGRNRLLNTQSQNMAELGFELVLGVELGFSIHFLLWVSVAPGHTSAVPLIAL